MPKYIAVLTIVLMLAMVVSRVRLMKRQGIEAFHFGKIDQKDFLIPPFALFYFYTVFANAFNLPLVSTQEFFHSEVISWIGVLFCIAGLLLSSGAWFLLDRVFEWASMRTSPTNS